MTLPCRRLRLPLLWMAALATLPACGPPRANGPADTFYLDFHMPPGSHVRGAIVFMVDGVNSEIFNRMLEAGELPNFQKYFVDRGLYAPHAFASTPTVTLANETSLVTGLYPGHHDITGVNWFDRNTLIWRDYEKIPQKNKLDGDYIPTNIYEQFPDEMTWSIFFQPHRGTTKFVEDAVTGGSAYFIGQYELVDRLTLSRFKLLMKISREVGRFPAVTYVYLLSPDFTAYHFGASSPQYHEALLHTDRQMGRVFADMERAGLLDKIDIAFVSDHGHWDICQHFDLEKFFQKRVGLDLDRGHWWERLPFEQRLKDYNHEYAVPYGSGDRYYAVCLRAPRESADGRKFEPWLVRPTAADLHHYPTFHGHKPMTESPSDFVDLLDTLVKLEATDVVAYRDGDDRVRILRKNGEVEFSQEGGKDCPIRYRLISGTDPLGFAGKVPQDVLAGAPASPLDWLKYTAATNYPDLPAQILAYFRSRRAGDLAVFAEPGWDFNHVNRSGHGGLRPGDLCVPMAFAGPGVPHKRVDLARTVDLVPTVLTVLDKIPPPELDGRTLIEPTGPTSRYCPATVPTPLP